MELIVANLSKSVRRETFNGREFLVAPITLIVPGVLNGSQGSQLYTLEELNKTVDAWNNMPMLLDHPKGVSGRSPKIIEKTGIGTLFNASVNGKLVGEGWFDIEKTNRLNSRIIPAIISGNKLEVSTGLRIDVETMAGVENGVSYEGIARHHRPDHLAILSDSIGACSVGDGCGVNNKEGEEALNLLKEKALDAIQQIADNTLSIKGDKIMSKLSDTKRKKMVDNLISNCKCWEEDDREELMKSSDRALNLYDTALTQTERVNEQTKELAENKEKFEQQEVVLNAAKEGAAELNALHDPEEDEEKAKLAAAKKSKNKDGKTKNEEAEPMKLEDLPEEVQNKLARFDKREAQDKEELITKMVAHLTENERQAAGEKWDKYDLEALQGMASSVIRDTTKVQVPNTKSDYTGQSVAHNREKKFVPKPLGIPVMNFDPEKS